MDVKYLLKDQAKCDELLSELNAIAVDICSYEYGLPMHDEGAKARMREALYRWATTESPNVELTGEGGRSPTESSERSERG